MSLKDQLRQIWDSFSTRKIDRGAGYKPDEVSDRLRTRIVMLYVDVVSGRMSTNQYSVPQDHSSDFWEQIYHALRVLYGRPKLSRFNVRSAAEDAMAFAENGTAKELFDFIETSFKVNSSWRVFGEANEFVEAINEILRMENAPYQLTPMVKVHEPDTSPFPGFPGASVRGATVIRTVAYPKVIRVDEEVVHTEAVLPALSVLADPTFSGASDEFRRALDDYRKDDFEDCVAKCGSAFESVLKVLCEKNGIPHDANQDTAGPLLEKVMAKSVLDTGTFKEPLIAVARMRNRLSSSHGGGSKVKTVERHVAQYALTSTAAAIVLLVHDMEKSG